MNVRQAQTPTFALTAAGGLALLLSALHVRRAQDAALVLLAFAGSGTAITLWAHVQRRGEEWGWRGLARALRQPDRHLWVGLATHAPQALLALVLLARSRRGHG